jgi:hypothetical protein
LKHVKTRSSREGQQSLPLDAQQFLVRDDPALVSASATALLLGVDPSVAAPLLNRELGLAEDLGNLLGRVPVLHHVPLDEDGEGRFDSFQPQKDGRDFFRTHFLPLTATSPVERSRPTICSVAYSTPVIRNSSRAPLPSLRHYFAVGEVSGEVILSEHDAAPARSRRGGRSCAA